MMELPQKHTDTQLIEKVLAGDLAIFEIIIRRNNPFLYRLGRSYNYNHEDTQDLMQDTFVNAYTNLASFQNRSSFKTWILKIMLNNCFKKQKKWSFDHVKAGEIDEKSTPMFTSQKNTDTERSILNKELSSVIESALAQIPLDYRVVFTLRESNELNGAEVAEILAISEDNVKTRLSRAKTMLRKEIEKFYSKEDIFQFNLIYCDGIVNRVMNKIKESNL
ncbi:sigma-70 family RNA polymerase sigma factor [Pedobacter arcticus]|uniref:sigma-70 family RNA polymerase sigma factor n=1 Tax=Pedobacter arcticus TaxID=752140 RepID=UPI00031CAFB6|nr:sigma-70 family RNA polymerase sigma factor [Pedobacter arcticus]